MSRQARGVIDVVVPDADVSLSRLHLLMTLADMADVHREEMEREPEQIGAEVLRRLKLGLDISGGDYIGEGGMPIGVQLVADSFGEALLFRAGVDFQQRTDFHLARPPLLREG